MPLFHRNAEWVVRSRDDLRWNTWLGNCSKEHAESVLEHLEVEPSVPYNLYIKREKR